MNNRSYGVICLCVFLICYGLIALTNFRFAAEDIIMGILAIAAGVLILMGK
jgi:hypothetical protein